MMPESHDSQSSVDLAEQAAAAGDYVSAEQFLREAVRLREQESGPLSPDLANTLNNLGVVSEMQNNADEAERCYRRAYEIAAATLPPDHPFVATSLKNLSDLRAARGKPIEEAPMTAVASLPPPRAVTPTKVPSGSGFSITARDLTIAALVLTGMLIALLVTTRGRPEPGGEQDAASLPSEQKSAPAAEEPSPAKPPVVAEPEPGAVKREPTSAVEPGAPAVMTARLCRTLSIEQTPNAPDDWPCTAATPPVGAGQLTFYTRLKSARDITVQHRWYHGDQLYQSVDLLVRANQIRGFRTYSRYTIKDGSSGNWRVELRSTDGRLLHQERFAVR
jgi:hypothetical protein